MRKKLLVYIFVLIWMVVAVQLVVNASMKRKDQIIEAFSVVDTIPVESDVEAYGYFGDMYLSPETKEQMLTNLAKELGITDGYFLESVSGETFTRSQLIKDGAFAKTSLQIISMETKSEDNADIIQQYFYATITIYNSVEQILYCRDLLEDTFENVGMKADVNIYLAGEIRGELDENKKEWLVQSFLESMEAKEVCGSRTKDMYTIYGYTPNEQEYVYQHSERVNVNIAITYDEERDKTRVHMAVPFIAKTF